MGSLLAAWVWGILGESKHMKGIVMKLRKPYLGNSDPLFKPLATYRTSSEAFKDADYGCALQRFDKPFSFGSFVAWLLVTALACVAIYTITGGLYV